jgi:PAS domain S-box-containing protein
MAGKPTYEELEQRVKDLEKEAYESNQEIDAMREQLEKLKSKLEAISFGAEKIQVSDINIEWNSKQGTCTFENLPVVMMWVDTTLAGLMSGVQAMVGTERFGLALQSQGRKSVEADWQVISQFSNFRDGFKAIANIAAVAGWGDWRLVSLNEKAKECHFRVTDSWEGRYQKGLGVCWGSGMLAGKMSGYCSKLFNTNCWTDQTAFVAIGNQFDEFVVRPSDRSIEKEIENLLLTDEATRADMAVALQKLRSEVSERKRAEETLRESEEKYRLLVENANDAIFIAQDEVIKFPNPKTEEMISYTEDELAKTPFVNIIHPEDREMVLDRYKRRLMGEELPSTYSFRIINHAGEELWVQLNAVLITWEGRPATLNFLRDITQEKKLEDQLQQAQRMEAIGTLAGGIAHDFNNLLMGIQGYASLMMLEIDHGHPNYEKSKNIEQLVRSGADLTKQLLGFARAGKFEVKPTDLNELIKKSSSMFGRTKKEIKIHRKYQKDIWPVEADQGQIEQALLNLYVNAWQAMPGGGDLFIETANVMLDENYFKPFPAGGGKYVKVSITDNGIGMDEATQQRIFDPFFTTKEMGRGTGLGLASAYGIIKGHAGIMNVYSEKGQGTTFKIYLPASEKVVVEEIKVPDKIIKGTETVLMVDDEEHIMDVGVNMLKSLGYTVFEARSAAEAIEIYKEKYDQIDMVILDMIMPGISGGEAYDRMREINPNITVLLSSGYSIDGQAEEIMKRGCNGFIQKPFNVKELSQKIREILDKSIS